MFRSDLNDKIIEVVAKKGVDSLRRSASCVYVTHSRDRHSEPQHPRYLDGSHAACIGVARGAGETPIQERRLRFTQGSIAAITVRMFFNASAHGCDWFRFWWLAILDPQPSK